MPSYGHSVSIDTYEGLRYIAVGYLARATLYTAEIGSGYLAPAWDISSTVYSDDTVSVLSVSVSQGVLVTGIPLMERVNMYYCPLGVCTYRKRFKTTTSSGTGLSGQGLVLLGDTLIIGHPGRNTSNGAIMVYQRKPNQDKDTATTWSSYVYCHAVRDDYMGHAVAVSGDMLVAGMPGSLNGKGSVQVYDGDYTYAEQASFIAGTASSPDTFTAQPLRDRDGEPMLDNWLTLTVNGFSEILEWHAEDELYYAPTPGSYAPGSVARVYHSILPDPASYTRYPPRLRLMSKVNYVYGPSYSVEALPADLQGDTIEVTLYNRNGLYIDDGDDRVVSVAWVPSEGYTAAYTDAEWDSDKGLFVAELSPRQIREDTEGKTSATFYLREVTEYGTVTLTGEVPIYTSEGLVEGGSATISPNTLPHGVVTTVELTCLDVDGRVVAGNNSGLSVSTDSGVYTAYWDKDTYTLLADISTRDSESVEVMWGDTPLESQSDVYTHYPYTRVREYAYDSDTFADTVVVSGEWAVIASPTATEEAGHLYIYQSDGCDWVLSQTIEISSQEAVTLAMEGRWLVLGQYATADGTDLYFYYLEDGVWTLVQSFGYVSVIDGEKPNDTFRNNLALSSEILVVGRIRDNTDVNGRAYVYRIVDGVWKYAESFYSNEVCINIHF
ncbi:hypothetical protein KIPB_002509 [Kipferlia bialata]|uniref:Uncharacterized protein n=1 Tax=Kipferlia bialata TaxID=797122 RepID=A0A9K3CSW2_9EUKA|nr:hypothetical protein KIPB_002509 [Kipferlia bialata]|eukprot:g2509.t1